MNWSSVVLPFLASIVEFVEALTIVLVVGVTINWKSSLTGAAAAIGLLGLLIVLFGNALILWIPIEALRVFIGVFLILFGLKWLKKAILRYAGLKAKHDEEAIYEEEQRQLRAQGKVHVHQFDVLGFVTSFKSVLLEGLEVAFIVITFGVSSAATDAEKLTQFSGALIGAGAALVLVILLGLALRGPLTKVPENTLKFTVGLMLLTFGTFWAGEGLGIEWLAGDWALIYLVGFYAVVSLGLWAYLRPAAVQSQGAN